MLADAIRGRKMKRLLVRVIEVRARCDAVIGEDPAGDLWLASATVVGVRVAAEPVAAALLERDTVEGAGAGEAGNVGRGDPATACAEPGDAIGSVRDDAGAVIRSWLVPEVEGRMREGHAVILSRPAHFGAKPHRPPISQREGGGAKRRRRKSGRSQFPHRKLLILES
jgi:hypothetical protein